MDVLPPSPPVPRTMDPSWCMGSIRLGWAAVRCTRWSGRPIARCRPWQPGALLNPRACLYYPGSPGETFKLLSEIFPDVSSAQNQGGAAFDIDILAIPPSVGLWIKVNPPQTSAIGNGLSGVSFGMSEALVYASGQCP